MTTILITGGAGFIGSNFVYHVAKAHPDYQIVVLDALTYAGSPDNLPPDMRELDHPRMRFWYGNVCNAGLVEMLVRDADYVVHFAAETHVTRSIFDNRLFFETDVMGTQTVANAVVKSSSHVKRLVHISTSEVYGSAERSVMDEEHALKPMSPYASAKCGADRLVYSYWATYKAPITILRPFNNFGPRQHLEKVVPRFITSALLGEPITVHGTGEAARDFVHVDDVCRAIDLVLHADDHLVNGEVFNIATAQHRTIRNIADDVARLMDMPSKIIHYGDRPGQVIRHTGDYAKIKSKLGWEPSLTWEEGLTRTIDWYKQNRQLWEKQIWMRHIPIVTAAGRSELH
ncbi:dTDP-glucose 4,6-dehydratase [Bradyrhizobium sp. WD16]|uniref:dTDP-glucose 4,6-dehydratase n=1 Tax=Bradyrhizobium sp. WD16 TaxID=1521768 RepID=UPI0020A58A31|nr:GDP-mannose 4,6-dehydratase [Bradyrhizobium sp. WD16]UTD29093.1 epimerase [Bradyrhizobium sp. WD16]